eukprot:5667368-Amphidinium_carterae.1
MSLTYSCQYPSHLKRPYGDPKRHDVLHPLYIADLVCTCLIAQRAGKGSNTGTQHIGSLYSNK